MQGGPRIGVIGRTNGSTNYVNILVVFEEGTKGKYLLRIMI